MKVTETTTKITRKNMLRPVEPSRISPMNKLKSSKTSPTTNGKKSENSALTPPKRKVNKERYIFMPTRRLMEEAPFFAARLTNATAFLDDGYIIFDLHEKAYCMGYSNHSTLYWAPIQ